MSLLVKIIRNNTVIQALSMTESKLLGMVVASSACWTLIFQRPSFLFIYWNLFLAWMPIGIQLMFQSHFFVRLSAKLPSVKPLLQGLGVVLWLLFLPNAPYILTDLIHPYHAVMAGKYEGVLLFTLCISAAAICGLLWFLRSLEFMVLQLEKYPLGVLMSRPITFMLLLLTSVGVWMGRILRFNSWDVLHKPLALISTSLDFVVTSAYMEIILVSTFFLWALWRSWERLRSWGLC